MSRQKQKGTLMESKAVVYLRGILGESHDIRRVAPSGSRDEGDIHGLDSRGRTMIAEVKNCRRYEPKEWLRQAEAERANAGADIGAVIFHVNGIGLDDMGSQGVLITLGTFCKLIGG